MRILFYGFRHGHILGCYRQAQQNPDVQIVAAIEENTPARLAAQEQLGITIDADGYDLWLEDPTLDTVAIGGAYGDRGAAIIKALQHGKHVLSDKPVCTSLFELAEIRALASAKGLKVGCLLDLRKIPAAAPVKALLESGRMGKVKSIGFTGQHCIDYAHRPGWYFEPGKHGGTINDIAIHAVDFIPYLTGQKISTVYCARTWNSFATRHPDFCDSATFMAETDGGASILADVSYAAPSQVFSMPTYWNFQIWCEKGLVTFCCSKPDVTIYEDGASGPEVLSGIPAATNILADFIAEVQQNSDTFTASVLSATETALRLQEIADAAKTAKGVTV